MGMVAVEKLEEASWLDPLDSRVQRLVTATLKPRWLRDLLHGVWLGHPLHAAMVQAPVGAWLSAAILDATPGQRRAATTLVAVGTAAAVPAAVAGWNDWATLAREQRRTGLFHAAANSTAVVLYTGSLVARLRGRHGAGRALSFAALAVAGTGAFLGGHLSFRQAAAVNHAAPELRLLPDGWHEVGRTWEFADGTPTRRQVGPVPVLVFRHGDEYTVLAERCAHQAGPLGDGTVHQVGGQPCVTCPWHGSTFRLTDGAVVRGPAATNQPTLRVRVNQDRVEVSQPAPEPEPERRALLPTPAS
jgi:nitrite reductase/ring-hydroxylating ferredoxin subunit